jgi:hypothetical protein
MATNEQGNVMFEAGRAELSGINGGAFIVVGDGFCGTPHPGRLPWQPLAAANPAVVSDPIFYVGGAGAGKAQSA